MKCRAAKVWMLTAELPQRPPAEVRRHVQRCPRCRRRYARLVRLIREVQQRPLPDCGAAQARFLRCLPPPALAPLVLATTPPTAAPPRRQRRHARRWLQVAVVLLGFGVTWFVLSLKQSTRSTPPAAVKPAPAARTQPPLEERLLEQHLRLAEAEEPAEKLHALAKMASDLRGESLREARRGKAQDLAFLVWLYQRVVNEGVVPCALPLAGGSDGKLRTAALAELRQTETEARQLARETPSGVARFLVRMANTARAATRVLLKEPGAVCFGGGVSSEPPVEVTARALLRVLVVQSLLVVREEDPVRRARYSTRVATVLAREILDRAETADAEEASRLGQSLGAVVDRAVMGNLDQVDPADANAGQKKEAAEVRQRVGAAVAAVQERLPAMPAAARGGLQHAFQIQGGFQMQGPGKKRSDKKTDRGTHKPRKSKKTRDRGRG